MMVDRIFTTKAMRYQFHAFSRRSFAIFFTSHFTSFFTLLTVKNSVKKLVTNDVKTS